MKLSSEPGKYKKVKKALTVQHLNTPEMTVERKTGKEEAPTQEVDGLLI